MGTWAALDAALEVEKGLGMPFSMNFGKNEPDVSQMKSAEGHTASTLRSNFRLADQVKENCFAEALYRN